MKIFASFIIMMILIFSGNDKLTGRWQSKPSAKGNVTGVVFSQDSIMEGYVNRKPFVSGIYHFNSGDSVFSFVDNGCNGARGVYKILFYHNQDSLRFKVISDSCEERKAGMLQLVMGRIK